MVEGKEDLKNLQWMDICHCYQKGVEGQKNPFMLSGGQRGKEVQVPISLLGATKGLELEGEVEGQSLCQG